MPAFEYDIALSFAGEDRSCAEDLALACINKKIRVFYDKFEEHDLWGKDLIEYLYEVYGKKARYCIILISKHYVASGKGWPKHERKSAQERQFREEGEYILPIRLDDTPVPGLPETISYIRLSDYTIDSIVDLIIRKLGYPLRDELPIEEESVINFPEEIKHTKIIFEPIQDKRFIRHENLTAKLLPDIGKFGYYSLHSFSVPEINIKIERLNSTFLDINRAYTETLNYAQLPDVHPDGYTRRYDISGESGKRITTQVTSCYFNGYIITEGYLDEYCEGNNGFNPNWFIYEIQRHLQLTKEVFEDYITTTNFCVIFKDISQFKWEVYASGRVDKMKPYVGYHSNIIVPVRLSNIHGRDKWNKKMDIAEDILLIVARMFGMDRLPQPYWNEKGYLDYPLNISSR